MYFKRAIRGSSKQAGMNQFSLESSLFCFSRLQIRGLLDLKKEAIFPTVESRFIHYQTGSMKVRNIIRYAL